MNLWKVLSFGLILCYKFTLVQLLHYILKCNNFEMTTFRVFLVKIISIPFSEMAVRAYRFILCLNLSNLNYIMFPLFFF